MRWLRRRKVQPVPLFLSVSSGTGADQLFFSFTEADDSGTFSYGKVAIRDAFGSDVAVGQ